MARIRVYSLENNNGNVILSLSLIDNLVDAFDHQEPVLTFKFGEEVFHYNKAQYLNTGKVIDTGKHFFLVATKFMKMSYAKKVLLEYACSKIDARIDHLTSLKLSYQKLIAA